MTFFNPFTSPTGKSGIVEIALPNGKIHALLSSDIAAVIQPALLHSTKSTSSSVFAHIIAISCPFPEASIVTNDGSSTVDNSSSSGIHPASFVDRESVRIDQML